MATAQKEIPIGDDELDALMAQLEAETANVVDAPAAAPAPVVASADDELDALAAELESADEPAPAPADNTEHLTASPANREHLEKSIEQARTGAAQPRELVDPDADLAALEAELAETTTAPAARTVQITNAAGVTNSMTLPTAAPEPEPEPNVHLEGDAALQEVAATLEREMAKAPAAAAPAPTPAPATPPAAKKELNHYIDMAEFRREITVSVTNLDNCMMEQASLRAYHGEQAAHAEAQHSRLKLRHEVVEARLYDKHRKALMLTGEKVTEKMVENAVKQDPEYVASKNRVIEAETIAAVRRSCTDALRDRKDMLVQLGADRREEGKGQVRILAAEAQHMDKRAAAAAAVGSLRAA